MANAKKSPYESLQVAKDISYVNLRCVYRDVIHAHKQGRLASNEFRSKVRAYETLSDFEKRAKFDSSQEWISELPVNQYTTQQLAAEPSLALDLEYRLKRATLTDINAQDPVTGHTALYCAARAGNVQGVQFLIKYGAEPDLFQRTRSTALHVASFYGHADVVRYLLESGADYRIENDFKGTPEKEAYNNEVKAVFTEMKLKAFVRAAANEVDWFSKNQLSEHIDEQYYVQRQTLLHCASKKGHLELVRLLVERLSANLDILDVNFNSALHWASYGGHGAVVEYLLNQGCDSTVKNRWGTTAEEEGIRHGDKVFSHFQAIRTRDRFEMARQGVTWWFEYYFKDSSPDEVDYQGVRLLYYACANGKYDLVQWLLVRRANVNITMQKSPHSTPLHAAKYHGHLRILQLLLEYDADVNIKNDFNFTVFEETFSNSVDQSKRIRIEEFLRQYGKDRNTRKPIDIHIYSDNEEENEPIAKLALDTTAVYTDLIDALPSNLRKDLDQFSIARRPIKYSKDQPQTKLLAMIRAARHVNSRFFDLPICLTLHKKNSRICNTDNFAHAETYICSRSFQKKFKENAKMMEWTLKAAAPGKQEMVIDNLRIEFALGAVKNDITVTVETWFSPDLDSFEIRKCVCLFAIDIGTGEANINEMPSVSIIDDSDARLYTLAALSQNWFRSTTRGTRLPSFDITHGFFNDISVIPGHLSLPVDYSFSTTFDQYLVKRDKPLPCLAVELQPMRNDDSRATAYHGTIIEVVRSIVMDGLVAPGTVTASGKRIQPPKHHFARNRKYFGIDDFASAVFLSPSVYYSCDSIYARPFIYDNQSFLPVLECSVKKGSFKTNYSTVPTYQKHPGDDLGSIEWRVADPANIIIHAILFISQVAALDLSIRERQARLA